MYVYKQRACAAEHLGRVKECIAHNDTNLSVTVSDEVDAALGLVFDVSDSAGQRLAKLRLSAEHSLGWHTPGGRAGLASDIREQLKAIL